MSIQNEGVNPVGVAEMVSTGPDFTKNQTSDAWTAAIDKIEGDKNAHSILQGLAIATPPKENSILNSAGIGDKVVSPEDFQASAPSITREGQIPGTVDVNPAVRTTENAATQQSNNASEIKPLTQEQSAKMQELQTRLQTDGKLSPQDRLQLNKLNEQQNTYKDQETKQMEEGKRVSELLEKGSTKNGDGSEFTPEQLELAGKYYDSKEAEAAAATPATETSAAAISTKEPESAKLRAKFDKAKQNTTTGESQIRKGAQAEVDKVNKGDKLSEAEQKKYGEYISGVQKKIDGGEALTADELNDYEKHLNNLESSELDGEMLGVADQIEKDLNNDQGGNVITPETNERMANVVEKFVTAGKLDGDSLIAKMIRKGGPEPGLLKILDKLTLTDSKIVQEKLRDLAVLEMRAMNAGQRIIDLSNEACDIVDLQRELGKPPEPEESPGDLGALEQRLTYSELDARLAQKKADIVKEMAVGKILQRQYEDTRNTVDFVLGKKGSLSFILGNVGNGFKSYFTMVEITNSSITDAGKFRIPGETSRRYKRIDGAAIRQRAQDTARNMKEQAKGN